VNLIPAEIKIACAIAFDIAKDKFDTLSDDDLVAPITLKILLNWIVDIISHPSSFILDIKIEGLVPLFPVLSGFS